MLAKALDVLPYGQSLPREDAVVRGEDNDLLIGCIHGSLYVERIFSEGIRDWRCRACC